MAILSVAQAKAYASKAGFTGNALNIIVAIAQAESGLNTAAQHSNSDGSLDRGILQINARYHPEVSDACAYDATCSFQQGYRISSSGTNFSPWSTYTSGAYLRYMSSSGGAVTGSGTGKEWYQYPQTHGYIIGYQGAGTDTPHYAVDLGAPMDTPFFFLEPGTIDKADYQSWGGEVFERPDSGGPEEYVYHLDQISVKPGQHVSAGQVIGLSGGQNSGGSHPTSKQYSTGPHIHFGLFSKYTNTPDPNNPTIPFGPDPTSLISQAAQTGLTGIGTGGDSSTTTTTGQTAIDEQRLPLSEKVNAILSEFPGFGGICLALDKAEQFPGVITYNPGHNIQVVPPGTVGDIVNSFVSVTFDPADYIGAAFRSFLDTIISNAIPFFIRAMIASVGLLLVIGLVWKAADSNGLVDAVATAGVKAV